MEYSYWRNMNNHVGSADMYIFLGTNPERGGAGPVLIRYNKALDAVQNVQPMFDEASPYRYSTGEGWYFSAQLPTRLYTTRVGSPQLRRYDVLRRMSRRQIRPLVHFNNRWDVAAANHLAHGNARPLMNGERPYACGSNASRVSDVADEVVCFFADGATNADGALDVLVIAQVLTDLDASGGNDVDGDDYEQTPKGNLDVTGRYFLWTTNLGGGRLDAVLVKIPAERFAGR